MSESEHETMVYTAGLTVFLLIALLAMYLWGLNSRFEKLELRVHTLEQRLAK